MPHFLDGLKRTITGYMDSAGTQHPVKIIDGNPRAVSTPYYFEVAKGNIPNHDAVHLIGIVSSADNNNKEFNTMVAVDIIPVPAVAITLEIVSTSAIDTAAGSGGNTIEIHGLDANYDQISEVATLNGSTPVTTVNTYLRINNFHVMSLGAGALTAGIISVQDSGGGTTYANILAGNNNTLTVKYTIPRSFQAFITGWGGGSLSGNTTTKGQLFLKTTADPGDRGVNTDVNYTERLLEFQNGNIYETLNLPLKVPPKGKITGCIKRASGAQTLTGNISIDFFLDPA